jgi:hypothetical protein
MILAAAAITAAVVTGDHVALRAAPERTAPLQASLWKGDWLEVRGERKGWLKVYDHRHERPGWLDRKVARVVALDDAAAPQLRAVVDFLRDAPGSESLGIAYAALYMKVAPNGGIDAPLLVSVGVMADRLAHRASRATDGTTSEQLEVAQSWGIAFASIDRPDGARMCYDGAAFRQALALAPSPDDRATAVLALTEPECAPPLAAASEQEAHDEAALALLEQADPTRVAGPVGNRLRLRRAILGARLAWAIARNGDAARAAKVAEAAVNAFARLDKAEIADDDEDDVEFAALEVAASRWAALPAVAPGRDAPKLALEAGEPGETCIAVATSPRQCTHGQVWTASFRVAPGNRAAVLAVEPLPGWLELWMFRRGADGGWMVDVLAPSTESVELGYVELAGWSPDGSRAVIVREARTAGVVHRTWQTLRTDTLAVDKQTSTLAALSVRSWLAPEWRGRTLALR